MGENYLVWNLHYLSIFQEKKTLERGTESATVTAKFDVSSGFSLYVRVRYKYRFCIFLFGVISCLLLFLRRTWEKWTVEINNLSRISSPKQFQSLGQAFWNTACYYFECFILGKCNRRGLTKVKRMFVLPKKSSTFTGWFSDNDISPSSTKWYYITNNTVWRKCSLFFS